jgi:hypothetical protein
VQASVEGIRDDEQVTVMGAPLPGQEGDGPVTASLLGPAPGELDADWRSRATVWAVLPPFRASDPAPIPASGAVRFVLRPAGFLLAAPEETFPEEFGRLRVRLPDGRPIPCCEAGELQVGETQTEPTAWPGRLLGPFPEGTYAFEVRLGGVRLPDATATVKAGRIEVLRIRTRRE